MYDYAAMVLRAGMDAKRCMTMPLHRFDMCGCPTRYLRSKYSRNHLCREDSHNWNGTIQYDTVQNSFKFKLCVLVASCRSTIWIAYREYYYFPFVYNNDFCTRTQNVYLKKICTMRPKNDAVPNVSIFCHREILGSFGTRLSCQRHLPV